MSTPTWALRCNDWPSRFATSANSRTSAHVGVLTDSSYVQLVGSGVAAIDLGFPCRYTHSSLEVCDLGDLAGLTRLILAALPRIDGKLSLDRDDFAQ